MSPYYYFSHISTRSLSYVMCLINTTPVPTAYTWLRFHLFFSLRVLFFSWLCFCLWSAGVDQIYDSSFLILWWPFYVCSNKSLHLVFSKSLILSISFFSELENVPTVWLSQTHRAPKNWKGKTKTKGRKWRKRQRRKYKVRLKLLKGIYLQVIACNSSKGYWIYL